MVVGKETLGFVKLQGLGTSGDFAANRDGLIQVVLVSKST